MRPRARDLGIQPGVGTPGLQNAITDVAGVRVGHTTIVAGDTVRTGVTAILPHGGNLFREKVPGAVFVGNAFGKLAGSTQVQELGTIESPIVLTNTLAVGVALDAVVRWTLAQPGNENVRSVNALVGETNDGTLNDIRSLPVTREHVAAGDQRRQGGRGRRRRRRCRHRHGRVRVEGRHRHLVATSCSSRTTPGQSACSCSRTMAAGSTIAGVPVWRELSQRRANREPPTARRGQRAATHARPTDPA